MADYISSLTGQQMDDALEQMNNRLPEQWAVGQIDGVDVPSTNPRYHNNAKYYASKSADAVAHNPKIENGTWWVWNPALNPPAYEDTEVEAQGDSPTIEETLYQASESGTVIPTGTWTTTIPTVTPGQYLWTKIVWSNDDITYLTAYHGQNGTGIGDMQKSTYDTNNSGVVDNAERLGGQLPSYYEQWYQCSTLYDTYGDVYGYIMAGKIPYIIRNDKLYVYSHKANNNIYFSCGKAEDYDCELNCARVSQLYGWLFTEDVSLEIKDNKTTSISSLSSDNQYPSAKAVYQYHDDTKAGTSHTHSASDITSGTFDGARIPSLNASKITSGTFADSRIASASTWNAKASKPDLGTISLTDTWTGSASPYTQTVTVSGATVTANSKVDIQPSASVIAQLITDEVNALYIENNNGTLTCYAIGNKPTVALSNIQVLVTEVVS